MAVIYCPDCKKEMSDTASVCPNCGYPYAQKKELYRKAVELMKSCTTSNGYLGVAELFHAIPEFLNATELEKTCRVNAGTCYQQEQDRARWEAEKRVRQEEEIRRRQKEQMEQERVKREQELHRKEQEEKERKEREERERQK